MSEVLQRDLFSFLIRKNPSELRRSFDISSKCLQTDKGKEKETLKIFVTTLAVFPCNNYIERWNFTYSFPSSML